MLKNSKLCSMTPLFSFSSGSKDIFLKGQTHFFRTREVYGACVLLVLLHISFEPMHISHLMGSQQVEGSQSFQRRWRTTVTWLQISSFFSSSFVSAVSSLRLLLFTRSPGVSVTVYSDGAPSSEGAWSCDMLRRGWANEWHCRERCPSELCPRPPPPLGSEMRAGS